MLCPHTYVVVTQSLFSPAVCLDWTLPFPAPFLLLALALRPKTFWMRVPATGVTVHHGGGQEGSPARKRAAEEQAAPAEENREK
jgi:hypothetical protein